MREWFDHPYAAIAVAVVLMAGVAIVYTREVWLRLLIGVGLAVFLYYATPFLLVMMLFGEGPVTARMPSPSGSWTLEVRDDYGGLIDPQWTLYLTSGSGLLARERFVGCVSGDDPARVDGT